MLIWKCSVWSSLFTWTKTMFNLWVFDLIWVCWAISGQSKCCRPNTIKHPLWPRPCFSQSKPFSLHLKTPTAPDDFVLMYKNRLTSNSAFLLVISCYMQSVNPQLGLNIVNLFIKQRVQCICMVHISLVRAFHSIKHLDDHWPSLQRDNSSPELLASYIIQLLDKTVLAQSAASQAPCWELELNS